MRCKLGHMEIRLTLKGDLEKHIERKMAPKGIRTRSAVSVLTEILLDDLQRDPQPLPKRKSK